MEEVAVREGARAAADLHAAIDRALGETDPELANLLTTQTYHEIGIAPRMLIGPDAGANFQAWATWGAPPSGLPFPPGRRPVYVRSIGPRCDELNQLADNPRRGCAVRRAYVSGRYARA